MKHNLSYYIENYFNKYLLKEIGVSNNTIFCQMGEQIA